MAYCKSYENEKDVDCVKCGTDNDFPYKFCCLNECGEHQFCKSCWKYQDKK